MHSPKQQQKSSGCDEITSTIQKACASHIRHPLSYICNHLLYAGIFPDCLKIAAVNPLNKKGDKASMTNYRSSSLLTGFFSKVLEKAVRNRLSQLLHTNNIVVTERYGFRIGISTEDAAFRLTDSVFRYVNQRLRVGGIFCDLVKAFDCVNHEIWLGKLHFCGIEGVLEGWFRFCLTNRRQEVEVQSPSEPVLFADDTLS